LVDSVAGDVLGAWVDRWVARSAVLGVRSAITVVVVPSEAIDPVAVGVDAITEGVGRTGVDFGVIRRSVD
jgi:hypothetical protein